MNNSVLQQALGCGCVAGLILGVQSGLIVFAALFVIFSIFDN